LRILVIEDERSLAHALRDLLENHGYETDLVETVFDGIERASSNAYDCLVVDVMLPDGDGFELISELRQLDCLTPALILTARNDTTDRIRGLNAGADDYLGKPFDSEELVARIQALVRRSGMQKAIDTLRFGAVTLYRNSRTLEYQQQVLELSSKEFMLLEYFIRHPGQVLTRDQLIYHLWGPEAEVADNALDTYVYFLRKKCGKIGLKKLIRTIRGEGYTLDSESRR
jgi:DNA-binding response OmpR family regulator